MHSSGGNSRSARPRVIGVCRRQRDCSLLQHLGWLKPVTPKSMPESLAQNPGLFCMKNGSGDVGVHSCATATLEKSL